MRLLACLHDICREVPENAAAPSLTQLRGPPSNVNILAEMLCYQSFVSCCHWKRSPSVTCSMCIYPCHMSCSCLSLSLSEVYSCVGLQLGIDIADRESSGFTGSIVLDGHDQYYYILTPTTHCVVL